MFYPLRLIYGTLLALHRYAVVHKSRIRYYAIFLLRSITQSSRSEARRARRPRQSGLAGGRDRRQQATTRWVFDAPFWKLASFPESESSESWSGATSEAKLRKSTKYPGGRSGRSRHRGRSAYRAASCARRTGPAGRPTGPRRGTVWNLEKRERACFLRAAEPPVPRTCPVRVLRGPRAATDCRRLCGLDALTRLHLSADSRQQENPQ